jgi:hypothetical protein
MQDHAHHRYNDDVYELIIKNIVEHEVNCQNSLPQKFVSWVWVVAMVVGVMGSAIGATWYLSGNMQEIRSNEKSIAEKVSYITDKFDDLLSKKK